MCSVCSCVCVSVATGSSHPDYLGYLGHFLSGSKWVSPGHACMPDLDQNYLSCASKIAMKRIDTF